MNKIIEIKEYIQKTHKDQKNGIVFHHPLSLTHEYIEYLLNEIEQKDSRLSKLERIIVDDRIAKLEEVGEKIKIAFTKEQAREMLDDYHSGKIKELAPETLALLMEIAHGIRRK